MLNKNGAHRHGVFIPSFQSICVNKYFSHSNEIKLAQKLSTKVKFKHCLVCLLHFIKINHNLFDFTSTVFKKCCLNIGSDNSHK